MPRATCANRVRTSLQIDVKLQQNEVIHLVCKIGNRPAVEELILVTGIHIEMFPERPVAPDKTLKWTRPVQK